MKWGYCTAFAIIGMAIGFSSSPAAMAAPNTVTIEFQACSVEDCSDQPGQVGVWTNKEGRAFLIIDEHTFEIS